MKKSLFMLGVAVAALASCTQSEVLDIAESNVIKFDNAFVGKPTRAVKAPEVTTADIDKMYVFAHDNDGIVFDKNPKMVYKITGTDEWGYDNLVQWKASNTYQFVAYAGKEFTGTDGTVSANSDNKSLKFENIVVDGEKQFDLLYSNNVEHATSAITGNPKIEFTFEHLLSMVQFTLKSGFGATTKVEVSNFKFYGLKTTETYDANAWTATSTANKKDATNFTVAGPETAQYKTDGSTDVVNSWVIIPQQNHATDKVEMVSFDVKVTDGDPGTVIATKSISANIPSITWTKGNRYNYIFTITPEVVEIEDEYITFDAPTVSEWTDNDLTVDQNTSSTEGVELN